MPYFEGINTKNIFEDQGNEDFKGYLTVRGSRHTMLLVWDRFNYQELEQMRQCLIGVTQSQFPFAMIRVVWTALFRFDYNRSPPNPTEQVIQTNRAFRLKLVQAVKQQMELEKHEVSNSG